jgi:glycosyltransferase involved in cell wall biosynthesis
MKIIFTINAFPFDAIAGDRLYVYHIASALKKNHEVAIYYRDFDWEKPDHSVARKEFDNLLLFAFNHRHLSKFKEHMKLFIDFRAGEAFRSVIREFKPDIIHFNHSGPALGLSVIMTSAEEHIPSVLTLHNYGYLCPLGTLLKPNYQLCTGSLEGIECALCVRLALITPQKSLTIPTPLSFAKSLWLHGISKHITFNPARLYNALLRVMHSDILQLKRKTELNFHNIPTEDVIRYYLHNRASLKALSQKVSLLISPSNFLREVYVRWGIPPQKIISLTNGIDFKLFNNFKKKSSPIIRFAFMGRITWVKGVHVLIQAFNRLKGRSATLDLYGEIERTREQIEFYQTLNEMIDNQKIKFRGSFDNREIGKIMQNVDVLVVPSIWYENQPLTIQEAFLTRTPVITSNIGGMAELVEDGVNGLLFQANNPDDLAKKMQLFIDNPLLLKKLKADPKKVVSMEKHAKEVEKIFEKIIEKQKNCKIEGSIG